MFNDFSNISSKPIFLGEYGADAFNSLIDAEDQASQAEATRVLTQELVNQSAANNGTCLGGLIFEWADEWHKAGNPNQHDTGGIAPGGGPYPDQVFNEEWWGIVDVDRVPREAYHVLSEIAVP